MKKLFFTVREWNRFSWSMQEVLCKKYEVILTDYRTRKEKTISLLNKINMKNFNKGMNAFNRSLNKFSKTVDSLTASANKSSFKDFDQGKNIEETFGSAKFLKDEIWGKSIRLSDSSISIWPKKTKSDKPKDNLESIWGERDYDE